MDSVARTSCSASSYEASSLISCRMVGMSVVQKEDGEMGGVAYGRAGFGGEE